ncbi:MAG TPA: hypothetical protein VFT36_10385 [Methylomirabilota bacterium]|nr:hypothetical protein [Methylomirabilota bacterium]
MNATRSIAAALILVLVVTGAGVASAEDTAGATAAAVVSDIFYVPGKAIVCGLSGLGYVIAMTLTFGFLYQESTDFVKGGCGGQWVLTGEDIKPTPKSY